MNAFFSQPYLLIALLAALSLLPILAVVGSAFLKVSIVLSLLRNAIGLQQIPPNLALYGISLILSTFIMAPVGIQMHQNLAQTPLDLQSPHFAQEVDQTLIAPYRTFLKKFSDPLQVEFFSKTVAENWTPEAQAYLAPDSLFVLLPAFCISQLIEAFKIGLLLYLPFIAIDLIVSNLLLAMGMMMVSPLTIAMPFKMLLFVQLGGWEKLFEQLVFSYL